MPFRVLEVVMSDLSINSTITVLFDKLNLSTNSAVSNSTSTKTLSTTSQQEEISVDDEASHFLMLKDNINEAGYLFSSVSVTTSNLSKIGDYLAEMKENVDQRQSLDQNTDEYSNLSIAYETKEREMSAFIGDLFHSGSFEIQHQLATTGSSVNQDSLIEFVNIYEDPETRETLLGTIAAIEVDFASLLEANHNPETCTHCKELAASNNSNQTSSNSDILEPYSYNQTYPTNTTTVTGSKTVTAPTSSDSDIYDLIETIRMGVAWDLEAGENVTYSYYDGDVDYDPNYNGSDVNTATGGDPRAVNDYGSDNETLISSAFDLWDEIVEFDFEEVEETGTMVGEMRVAYTTAGVQYGRAAFAYGPYGSVASGDVWFEIADTDVSGASDFDTAGIDEAGGNYYAALHEIGHAIGLAHPFDSSASGGTGATLASTYDTQRYSVMSYTRDDRSYWIDYDLSTGSSSESYTIYSSTPMILDVAMMQYVYGAETSGTSSGDTTYSYDVDPKMLKTIWDTGGTDTIDASNQTRETVIDLREGQFSSIGIYEEADQITDLKARLSAAGWDTSSVDAFYASNSVYTGADNLAIAYGAVIENAKGGSADDTITGNSADNEITGGAGDDTIDGGAGDDTAIYSGAQTDYTITTNNDGTLTVTEDSSGDADTLSNVEDLSFVASSDTAAVATTSVITLQDLSSVDATFEVSVDGGSVVNVTLSQTDYTSGGLALTDFAQDVQTQINNALSNAGQSSSVTVTVNSPLAITSNSTGSSSSIAFSNLSAGAQTALNASSSAGAGISIVNGVNSGGVTSYNVASGASSVSSSGNSSSSSSSSVTGIRGYGVGGTASKNNNDNNQLSMHSHNFKIGTGGINISSQNDANLAIENIDLALEYVASMRAKLGAVENRLEHSINSLMNQSVNVSAARGRVLDADMALESTRLVKHQILNQAAQFVLSASYTNKNAVLGLIS